MAIAVVTGCSTGIAQASAYSAPANCMKFNEASTTTTGDANASGAATAT
jgi:hypothetical protein